MEKTGESYATARRQVLRQTQKPPADPASRWHFPGNVPAATALRVLLAHAGVRAPHTGAAFTEAMVFGIAGGVGAGVFSFLYEAQDQASFFVAGRHLWQDDLEYLRRACERVGVTPTVRESAGAKTAEKQLSESLADGPCVAWVDMAHLPHRGLPAMYSGGGYHVVTVYRVDADTGTALIGDLADDPIPIALADLAIARGRIKKQKNRLLTVSPVDGPQDLSRLVREGLQSCYEGLTGKSGKGSPTNFSLESFRVWAERMHGSKDKERWERVFTGPRLWRGLTSVYSFIEYYGTGGGLCRPLFADFLAEAAEGLGKPVLRALAKRYAQLGRDSSALADAALPDDVPAFREAKETHAHKIELTHSGGPTATEEVRNLWERSCQYGRAGEPFPLSDEDCAALRQHLQRRIAALYEGERAAHAALGEVVGSLHLAS